MRVQGLRFGGAGLGFRVEGSGLKVWGSGYRSLIGAPNRPKRKTGLLVKTTHRLLSSSF